jgi:hypothetical protein
MQARGDRVLTYHVHPMAKDRFDASVMDPFGAGEPRRND